MIESALSRSIRIVAAARSALSAARRPTAMVWDTSTETAMADPIPDCHAPVAIRATIVQVTASKNAVPSFHRTRIPTWLAGSRRLANSLIQYALLPKSSSPAQAIPTEIQATTDPNAAGPPFLAAMAYIIAAIT
ncbi:hypothetical protein [Streptomyces sp. OV198]|uniref:hypothetical protein n=1 Tax=Streptomyces sp. OV198 TaxID=1882787 RepID=UPI00211C03A3|nr:hypothetical protein [Streptomyces sp. OV198]